MAKLIPGAIPQAKVEKFTNVLKTYKLDQKAVIIGVRGYYLDSMGVAGKNDRGIYDDAIFVLSPSGFKSFNANVDPSRFRAGKGTGSSKGMASLKSEQAWLYKIGKHGISRGNPYTALVQASEVTVLRDGVDGEYPDTGYFGINIHRGGASGTSSLGCQTIVPSQWEQFISLVQSEMKQYGQKTIPYILIENSKWKIG